MHVNVHVTDSQPFLISAANYLPSTWVENGNTFSVIKGTPSFTPCETCDDFRNLHLLSEFGIWSRGLGVNFNEVADSFFVFFTRQTKPLQNFALNYAAKQTGCRNYEPVINLGDGFAGTFKGKDYILKPENGARGIGQLKLNSNEASIDGIRRAIAALRVVRNNSPDKFNTELAEKEFSALLKREVKFQTKREHAPNEGIGELVSNWCVTEHIPNILEEYRLIVNYDSTGICYGIKRDTFVNENDGHIQATGSEGNLTDTFQDFTETDIPLSIINNLRNLLAKLYVPLHAFDLFLTKEGTWGIFEISPDFGGVAVPGYLIENECKKFVSSIFE